MAIKILHSKMDQLSLDDEVLIAKTSNNMYLCSMMKRYMLTCALFNSLMAKFFDAVSYAVHSGTKNNFIESTTSYNP